MQQANMQGTLKMQRLFWREPIYRNAMSEIPVKDILIERKSEYQAFKVVELEGFQKVLLIDGFTQSAQSDEFVYHEAIAHPALLVHPHPVSVFLGGSAEMSALKEILRHKSVKKVVMVDIDKALVDFAKQHLKEWGENCWNDPRVEFHYEDARGYLNRCKQEYKQSFDVVIMDICDPTRGSESIKLYEKEFYEELKQNGALNPGFVLIQQCGPGSQASLKECSSVIHNTMKTVFTNVVPYLVHIPSFFDVWSFNMAWDSKSLPDPRSLSSLYIDLELGKRMDNVDALRFYCGQAHTGLFGLPKFTSRALLEEKRIITKDNPFFMNSEYEEATGSMIEKS